MATATEPIKRKLKPEEMRAALKKQPLVGLTAAAKILGMAPPNVNRLRDRGEMPPGIHVEGSADVFLRAEVEALAKRRTKAREKRNGA